MWAYADRFFDGDQRRDIGYTALRMGAHSAAHRLLGHPGTTIAPDALNQVAAWLHGIGDTTAARRWYRQAIDSGHPDTVPTAMTNLGLLEAKRRNIEAARRWWRQAAATDHTDAAPKAMNNLGLLEAGQGNLEEARRWHRKAVDTGHPEVAVEAASRLRELDRTEQDRRRAEWFTRYGWQAYADQELIQRRGEGPDDAAE
ncbi:tetratricopeptide repeat protein [Actinoallomurus sp. CA-142502]|uniref:tetratricopeptide repeat protein n=1 Tax=Actinoallomurus sp. CA-142502 TaxID=3239885 RepID=UPI003D8EDEAC